MINNLFLGIETSCDDTCISIFNNKYGVISEYVFTQLIHIKYGGTVPELASKDHLNKIFNIIFFVLKKKKINIFDIKIIAYTKGPGLKGSLFIGASVAKSLSLFLNIPAIAINHLEAHIIISFAFNKIKQFPALVLLISGANTILLKMFNYNNYIFVGLNSPCISFGLPDTKYKMHFPYSFKSISHPPISQAPHHSYSSLQGQ